MTTESEPIEFSIPRRGLADNRLLYLLMPHCDSATCNRRILDDCVKVGEKMYHAGCVPSDAPKA